MFFEVEAFHKVFDWMHERFRVPVIGSLSPEGTLKEAMDALKIRHRTAEKQPRDAEGNVDMYACWDQESTWKEVLGFKNLFAINETGWNEGGHPVDRKYVDNYKDWIYFSGEEKATLCQYWDTGDLRYLYQWRDRGEDSDYNRLYYPLEHYGSEPIYEREDGKEAQSPEDARVGRHQPDSDHEPGLHADPLPFVQRVLHPVRDDPRRLAAVPEPLAGDAA